MWNQSVNHIYVAGHRGLSARYPENTMPSFRAALEAGLDMIELDVHRTKDGQLIVMHDHTVDRTTDGTGPIAEKTLEEIKALDAGGWFSGEFRGERVPTLREFMELVKDAPKDFLIDFELKEYPVDGNEERAFLTADETIAMAEEYGYGDRCVFNAFNADLLQYIHEKYNGKYKIHGYYPLSLMGEAKRDPYDYMYCGCVCELTEEAFGEFRSHGVDPWVGASIDCEEKILQAHRLGATLITCNNGDEVLSILRRLGLHP